MRAHNNLGNLLMMAAYADYDGAEVAFRAAIKVDPTEARAYNNLGILLQDVREDYDGAEAAFRTAIKLDPQVASAHCNLGNLLKSVRRDADGAESAYRMAIAVDPLHAKARSNLGNLLMNVRGDFDGAEIAFRQALELDPSIAGSQWNLSKVLEVKGDLAGAIKATERYIQAGDPDNDGEERVSQLRAMMERSSISRNEAFAPSQRAGCVNGQRQETAKPPRRRQPNNPSMDL